MKFQWYMTVLWSLVMVVANYTGNNPMLVISATLASLFALSIVVACVNYVRVMFRHRPHQGP